MKKFQYTVILILLSIVAFIFIANWWLNKYFFKVGQDYPSELIDFQPTKLNYHSDRPIYYYSENKLYYDSLGIINLNSKPIWIKKISIGNGRENGIFVSPNSQYVAFNENHERIIIIDKHGKLKHKIETFDKAKLEDATFWGKEIQWNENSSKLYFMQYRNWEEPRSKKNRSTLYSYSLIEDKIKKEIDLQEECCEDFYISRDMKTLYYRFVAGNGSMPFKKVDIPSGKYIGQFKWDRWHKMKEPNDSIFINFPANYFNDFSHNHENLICQENWRNYDLGLYHYTDTSSKLILKGKNGYNAFKGFYSGFYIDGEFLFGNRYYTGRISSKDIKGTIIIDIIEHKYEFIDKFVYCFFSITNDDPFNFEHNISETDFKKSSKEIQKIRY